MVKTALLGNVDVRTLCAPDVEAVQREVRRCTAEGGPSGFMLSTCNSIFPGMNQIAVRISSGVGLVDRPTASVDAIMPEGTRFHSQPQV